MMSQLAHVDGMEDTMMRKMATTLAAAAVVIGGSTLSAGAMRGGGGGMGHGGFGVGLGHAAMARPGGFGGFAAVHPMGMRGGHVVVGNRFHFGRRFVRNRFAFVGVGLPYYDDCYARVWTPWGWRWRYVCY
jgi:hypothetical protein